LARSKNAVAPGECEERRKIPRSRAGFFEARPSHDVTHIDFLAPA
jgi:hypothetical protein